jgi:hypothetical protein
MAEADWAFFADGLDSSLVLRGVTAGETPPPGGGNFVFGFNSIVSTAGAVGLYAAQTNFAPMAKGMSLSCAIKRGVSGGPTNFSPFLFCGCQNNVIGASPGTMGYMLGLADADPHWITLVKGPILTGTPGVQPPTSGVLAVGNETFLNNTWLQIRLDMIVNTNGDVILQMFRSDLTLDGASVAAPVWFPLPGAAQFVDDALGVNSGSLPFTSGYGGFGYATKDITRRAFFDQLVVSRQL